MQRKIIARTPGKIVRRVTIKKTTKPQPRRVVPAAPNGLPSIVVPNKGGGTRRIYYG